jgi:hypothetical protein
MNKPLDASASGDLQLPMATSARKIKSGKTMFRYFADWPPTELRAARTFEPEFEYSISAAFDEVVRGRSLSSEASEGASSVLIQGDANRREGCDFRRVSLWFCSYCEVHAFARSSRVARTLIFHSQSRAKSSGGGSKRRREKWHIVP